MEQILTGLGLSGSAGLNAYLPLLILGIMQRLEAVELGEPYHHLGSWPVLAVLTVLLIIEMTADKIPAVDHANDLINTAIRPAAGALLFAASTSGYQETDTELLTAASFLSGGISAGGVHTVKAMARPGVTLTTAGLGNFIVSLLEDVVSLIVSVFAILIPFVVLLFAFSAIAITGWLIWDIQRVRRYFPRTATTRRFGMPEGY